MTRRLLILDNFKGTAKYHYDHFVLPRLQGEVPVDVAKDAEAAEALILATQYSVAIVEAYVQPKPLQTGNAKTQAGEVVGTSFWSKLFGRKEPATVSVSIEGLTGRSVTEIIRSAADFLPSYATIRPDLTFIVVSHSRGGLAKEEKARLTACPNVAGLFGWLSTEANAKKVARLIAESLH
jgi:hypothetical protein